MNNLVFLCYNCISPSIHLSLVTFWTRSSRESSALIRPVFSGLCSGSRLFSRNWFWNGPDLHKKVRIWSKMEELTLKIGLFHHEFNDELNVLQSWKLWEFSKKSDKSLILWYWSGFKADSGQDLVRIGTKKHSRFGPILINLDPISQVVALGIQSPYNSLRQDKSHCLIYGLWRTWCHTGISHSRHLTLDKLWGRSSP